MSGLNWNRRATAARNAQVHLPALAREFFRAGDELAAAGAGPAKAHQFRIAAKQFRYTLELFRSCYSEEMEDRLQSLKQIQQCLGELNDYATIRQFARDVQMKAALETRIGAKIQEFHELWKDRFDRAARQAWVQYLKTGAGNGASPVR